MGFPEHTAVRSIPGRDALPPELGPEVSQATAADHARQRAAAAVDSGGAGHAAAQAGRRLADPAVDGDGALHGPLAYRGRDPYDAAVQRLEGQAAGLDLDL